MLLLGDTATAIPVQGGVGSLRPCNTPQYVAGATWDALSSVWVNCQLPKGGAHRAFWVSPGCRFAGLAHAEPGRSEGLPALEL